MHGRSNPEIARALAHLATMLEIDGANPFRVRAYREAARIVESAGEPVASMAEAEGRLESLQGIGKDLAGVDGRQPLAAGLDDIAEVHPAGQDIVDQDAHSTSPSVTAGDLDVVGVAIAPNEAKPPLVIDVDTVLSAPIILQRLEMVALGQPQIGEALGLVQLCQPLLSTPKEVRRKSLRPEALEDGGGPAISKRRDHAVVT